MIIDIEQWDSLSKDEQSKVTVINSKGIKPLSDVKDRPTMAFATMCKNEEEIINDTLESFKNSIDYLVFVDTQSTDKTVDIVVEFLKRTGIAGEIHIEEFKGFDITKSNMLKYGYKKTDYLMHSDSHMHLKENFIFEFKDEGHTQYYMQNKRGSSIFPASIIFKNNLIWRFAGVRHTIIVCDTPDTKHSTGSIDLKRGYILHGGSGKMGKRSSNPNKYKGDALALEGQFWKTIISDPDNLLRRSAFYAAQSWKDQAEYKEAMKWYSMYTQLKNTWIEEVYMSYLGIANCMIKINKKENKKIYSFREIEGKFIKAINLIIGRAEGYYYLGNYYASKGMYNDAIKVYESAKSINYQEASKKYKLFLIPNLYGLHVNDILSVMYYKIGKKQEGLDLIKEVYDLPEFIKLREHFDNNIKWFNKL